jgi:hypothetical protein
VKDILDDLDAEDMPPSPRLVESEWGSALDFRLRIEESDGRDVAIKLYGPTRFGDHVTVAMVGTPTDGETTQVLIHVALSRDQAGVVGDALKHLASVKP